jgi:methyltransferase (TIGR00027 family)
MREARPSQTAIATAFLRALHVAVGDAPHVFEDTAAAAYLPVNQRRYLEWLADLAERWRGTYRLRRHAAADVGSQVLVRARYAEDALAAAVGRGCQRYVILGAGLDTYAERHIGDRDPLPVIEIDHPATQEWKRGRLTENGRTQPPAATYRSIDFERMPLGVALDDFDAPQFISWLGTTYYLTRDAIANTLSNLCEHSAPGSELVLDYWREPRLLSVNPIFHWGARIVMALQPEPLRSFFGPHEMENLAASAGWRIREHCAPDIQNARYLAGRTDGLRVPSFAFLLHLEK